MIRYGCEAVPVLCVGYLVLVHEARQDIVSVDDVLDRKWGITLDAHTDKPKDSVNKVYVIVQALALSEIAGTSLDHGGHLALGTVK